MRALSEGWIPKLGECVATKNNDNVGKIVGFDQDNNLKVTWKEGDEQVAKAADLVKITQQEYVAQALSICTIQ